jgi:hypothetical protein
MANGSNLVSIRDIDVPFWRIVLILIKWSIAAIPAAVIIGLVYAAVFALLRRLRRHPPDGRRADARDADDNALRLSRIEHAAGDGVELR